MYVHMYIVLSVTYIMFMYLIFVLHTVRILNVLTFHYIYITYALHFIRVPSYNIFHIEFAICIVNGMKSIISSWHENYFDVTESPPHLRA